MSVAGTARPSSPRRFLVSVLAVWAALFALHPAQHTFWFDIEQRLTEASRLPLSVSGAAQAIALQARVHSPNYVRPVRAIQWLVLATTLGVDPWKIYVTNILSLGLAIACLMELARHLGANPYVTGLCFAASYATVLPIIFIGFGFTLFFGFLGLLAYFRGAVRIGFSLLLIAALSHETMLALSLIPLAHAVIERTPRGTAWLAAAVIPIYIGCGVVHALIFGRAPVWTSFSEGLIRVVFAFASGGLPLEPVRALPWFPPFLRVRELLLTRIGLLTLIAVCLPAMILTVLACRRAPRRRVLFCGVWAAFGFLPLLLPVTTPEAYHLSIALAAVFILWASQPLSRTVVIALVAWLLLHGWARERLFYHDLPVMAKAVDALRPLRDDARAVMVNAPIQIGPHYAMLPDLGFHGCFVDPLWIWSSEVSESLEREKQAARRMLEAGTSFVRLCALTWDLDSSEVRRVEGPRGFETYREALEASRFLCRREGQPLHMPAYHPGASVGASVSYRAAGGHEGHLCSVLRSSCPPEALTELHPSNARLGRRSNCVSREPLQAPASGTYGAGTFEC